MVVGIANTNRELGVGKRGRGNGKLKTENGKQE
jgi:hypothetical protein